MSSNNHNNLSTLNSNVNGSSVVDTASNISSMVKRNGNENAP